MSDHDKGWAHVFQGRLPPRQPEPLDPRDARIATLEAQRDSLEGQLALSAPVTLSTHVDVGYIRNCYIVPRAGETVMAWNGNQMVPTLDNYAILPREQFDALSAKAAVLSDAALSEAKALTAWYVSHAEWYGGVAVHAVSRGECDDATVHAILAAHFGNLALGQTWPSPPSQKGA